MKSQEILDCEDKVIKELSNWICKELKNTSSVQTESILPEIIKSFANLVKEHSY